MAIIAFASFTAPEGTNVLDYALDLGGALVAHQIDNAGPVVISNQGRARSTSNGTTTILLAQEMPVADYDVFGTVRAFSVVGSMGILVRVQPSASTGVAFGYDADLGGWLLAELVNGVIGTIQVVPATLQAGQDYQLKLLARGSVVEAYVNGQLVGSIQTVVTTPGHAAFSCRGATSNSTGLHLDDWGVAVPDSVVLAAAAEVESDAAAALRATRRIAVSLECETDADIEAAIARVLASVAQVDPDVVPVMRPARLAAAQIQTEADVLGELAVEKIIRLAAVLEAEGAVTGGLRVARELAAVVDAEVDVDAVPEVRRLLAAQLAADADAAVPLHVARALAAALAAEVDASAMLLATIAILSTLSVQVVGAARSAMARELAGPALARAVRGPALSRAVRGPALRRFEIEGPAAS